MTDLVSSLLEAADRMNARLADVACGPPVDCVYNPFDYARPMIEAYYRLAVEPVPKEVVLVGMNPGPWGMAQTGVPFGEVGIVKGWMELDAPIGKPDCEHKKRPVDGLACTRSEVSGKRLWGAIAERYPRARDFFRGHFVSNWCPLLFLEESGRNLPPDKLKKQKREELARACDAHLRTVVELLSPRWVIGIGAFAEQAAARALEGMDEAPRIGRVLHPSPASPKANKDWVGQARAELEAQGVPVFL